jgi:hypothetical protein
VASDSFTNADGTALATHDANWATSGGYTNIGEINTNSVRQRTGYQNVSYRYSTSSSDDCQIVKLSHSEAGNGRWSANVRSSSSSLGYQLRMSGYSDPNYGSFLVRNGATEIGGGSVGGTTFARTGDATMRIQATTVGGDVELRVWINGVAQTFGYASGTGNSYSGAVLTNGSGATPTPITSGEPGFYISSSVAAANGAFDDWDDLVSAGDPEGSLIQGKLLRGGLLLGGVLTR